MVSHKSASPSFLPLFLLLHSTFFPTLKSYLTLVRSDALLTVATEDGTERERVVLVRRNTVCFTVASVEFPPDRFRSLTFFQMFCMMLRNVWIY